MEMGETQFVRWVSLRGTTGAPRSRLYQGSCRLAVPPSSKGKNLRESLEQNEYSGTCTSPEFSRSKFTVGNPLSVIGA